MVENIEEKQENASERFQNETGTTYKEPKGSAIEELVKSVRNLKIDLIPHPNRLFCLEVPLAAEKLASGLYLPEGHQSGVKEGQKKRMTRYIIVSLGDEVAKLKFKGKKIEVGDEMIYCDMPDAVRLEIPKVIDFSMLDNFRKIQAYTSFDIMEIHGIIKH